MFLKPGCPPCPTSFASVAAADLARQHLEWAQELESVDPWHEISGMDSWPELHEAFAILKDQRQADLTMTQWHLVSRISALGLGLVISLQLGSWDQCSVQEADSEPDGNAGAAAHRCA